MEYWLIEDCCEILDSMRVPITAADRKSGIYPYYGANGIQDHVADYIFDDELVLLAEDGGNFGSNDRPIAYRVSGKCWVNNHAHVLKPKDGLNVDYLCYSLMFYDTSGIVNGATRQKLTQAEMRRMKIPKRSHAEQLDIVNRVKSVESIIQDRKRQLESFDTLIKARFVEMFGDLADPASKWPTCRLIEACDESDDIKCGPFGTQLSKDEYQESGIPVWEIPQINSAFALAPEHFLTVEKAAQLRAYSLSVGDIVMSRKGNVGKCAIFPADKPDGILHSDVLRIRVSSKITNPCFMMCQLHYSRDIIRQIEMVSSGAIMAGVNVTKLKEIIVKMPPLELQNQFAAFVYQVDKSKAAVQAALEKTQLLFDSLMQQYFG